MSYSVQFLLLVAVGYLFCLFLAAWITDRGLLPARVVRHPAVYVLSLGVYSSAWAMFGAVGYAHAYGYNYMAYFLGIGGAFMLAPILLAPILRITTTYQLSSLADLFAFRFRSRAVGILTTLAMLISMLPLLALQLKAVSDAVHILGDRPLDPLWVSGIFCLMIMVLAIVFGTRHSTTREKHEGLVVAMALESLIKLLLFVGLALLGLFSVFDGPFGLNAWLEARPEMLARLYFPLQDGSWHSLVLAFFVSAVVMPHMFYMTFTENLNPRALVTASWAVPLMLLLMALCVPVILWAAQETTAGISPDYFTLALARHLGGGAPALAWLAGLTGASGMLIVATVALSNMGLNHLVLPLRRRQATGDADLYRWLLWTRRLLIVSILGLAWLFHALVGHQHGLSELGVLTFVATLQFVPGLIGTLTWPGANRYGLISGLIVGLVIWLVGLGMPILTPGHPALALDLFGVQLLERGLQWQTVALVSVGTNVVLFALVSLLTRATPEERSAAEACAMDSLRRPYRWELEPDSVDDFVQRLAVPLGASTARREVDLALRDLNLSHNETRPYALRRLRDQLETNLSGLLGPSVAHQMVDEHLPYKPHDAEDSDEDIQFIESRLELYRNRLSGLAAELDSLRRFHRQTLLELPLGVISLGGDGEIIGWNLAMEALTGISGRRMVGSRLASLPAPWRELLLGFVEGEDAHVPRAPVQLGARTLWLSLNKSRVHSTISGERDSGLVVVVADTTEVRELEARLAHHERLASIGRLAAGVAHEIGNPVTAIACLAQNLTADEMDELQRNADQILEQTRRISRIVESLVTFSHSGSVAIDARLPVDIGKVAEEARTMLLLDPERRQHLVHNTCPTGLLVRGDAQKLLQVLVNLLSNAADASAPGEPITIRARRTDDGIEVEVEDRGEGIPVTVRETLFEPFVTSKPPGKGTGLGLAMVYSIVEDHQGSVRVESPVARGRGTRIVIRLPEYTATTMESP